MALSDSPWLLNLNLEWENKADFKLLLNSLYSVEVRLLSLGSAHELEHCNEYSSVFSLCFPRSSRPPQCTAYLSYYWTVPCALGLADGSPIFFFLCPGHRKICRKLLLVILLTVLHTLLQEKSKPIVLLGVSTQCLLFIRNVELIIEGKCN